MCVGGLSQYKLESSIPTSETYFSISEKYEKKKNLIFEFFEAAVEMQREMDRSMSLRDLSGGKRVKQPGVKATGGAAPRKILAYRRRQNVNHRMLPYSNRRDHKSVDQQPKDDSSDDDSEVEIPESLENSPKKVNEAASGSTKGVLGDLTNRLESHKKAAEDEEAKNWEKQLKAEKEQADWDLARENEENNAQMEYVFSQFP